MASETYISSILLPSTISTTQFVISHPQIEGMFVISAKIPNNKYLSIKKVPVHTKRTKKVKEIRYFSKPNSVFAKWEDSPETVKACWEVDKKLMKLRKFIKSEEDLKATVDMLEKHYNHLKL